MKSAAWTPLRWPHTSGRSGSRRVEVIDAVLARMERLEPHLHAFCTPTPELARAEAKRIEAEIIGRAVERSARERSIEPQRPHPDQGRAYRVRLARLQGLHPRRGRHRGRADARGRRRSARDRQRRRRLGGDSGFVLRTLRAERIDGADSTVSGRARRAFSGSFGMEIATVSRARISTGWSVPAASLAAFASPTAPTGAM